MFRFAPKLQVLALVLGALPGSASTGSAAPPAWPGVPGAWIRFQSDSFTMITNTSPQKASELVSQLELLEALLAAPLPREQSSPDLPLRVFAFARTEHFAPYGPLHEGEPANVAGWFVRTIDGRHLAVDASAPAEESVLLRHEFVHAWLSAAFPRAPLWIQEGLAEYFGVVRREGDVVHVGEKIDAHVSRLSSTALLPLARLFELQPTEAAYHEPEPQSIFYAQSWALVHVLLARAQGRQEFHDLLHRLGEGERVERALEAAFGMGVDELEAVLADHVARAAFAGARIARDGLDVAGSTPEWTRLSTLEATVELGELIVRLRDARPGLAEAHFTDVLERDPDSVRARRGLAMVRAQEGNAQAAHSELARALAVAPDDPDLHLQCGLLLLDEWLAAQAADATLSPDATPDALLSARRHFDAALRVQPDRREALVGLASTYLRDRENGVAIDALDRAMEGAPWRAEWTALRVRLLANADRIAEARSVLERELRPRAQEDAVRTAEAAVVGAELRAVQDLLESGQTDEAAASITRALEATHDPALRASLEESREALARTRGRFVAQAEIEDYARALQALEARRFADARAIAARLAESATQPRVRTEAVALLRSIEEAATAHDAAQRYERAVELVGRNELEAARRELRALLQLEGLDAETEARVREFLDTLGG